MGFGISTVLLAAMFTAAAVHNHRLSLEATTAKKLACDRLALGLLGADNMLVRVRDDHELALATGPMSLAIGPVLSTCIEPGRSDALMQELAEARSVAAAVDVMRVVRDSLQK
jgi:hypothetical protein